MVADKDDLILDVTFDASIDISIEPIVSEDCPSGEFAEESIPDRFDSGFDIVE